MNKKINEEITELYEKVRVVDIDDLSNQEIKSTLALSYAKNKNLDLVLINDKVNIPICKIFDFKKKEFDKKKNQTKSKKVKVKTIQLGLNISDNDVNYRVNNAIKFLNKFNKIKVVLMIKGHRNMIRAENGKSIIESFLDKIEEKGMIVKFDSEPVLNKNTWSAIIIKKN